MYRHGLQESGWIQFSGNQSPSPACETLVVVINPDPLNGISE
jgi:hypothetical protein